MTDEPFETPARPSRAPQDEPFETPARPSRAPQDEPFETPARPSRAPQDERERSPRRGMCAAVLALEAITLGLTTPVLISISDIATGTALTIGLGLLLACVLVAGLLRRPWAYALGWAIQVAAIALGLVVGIMWVLGGIFALLWGMADLLGRRIERERAAAFAAYDARHAGS